MSSRERTGNPNHQLFNGHQWSILYPCQIVFRKHASWFTDCLRVVLSLTDRRRAVAVAWYDPSNVNEKLDLAGGFVRWKSQPASVQKLVLQLFWLWFAKHGSSSFSFVYTVYSGGVKGRNCTNWSFFLKALWRESR